MPGIHTPCAIAKQPGVSGFEVYTLQGKMLKRHIFNAGENATVVPVLSGTVSSQVLYVKYLPEGGAGRP